MDFYCAIALYREKMDLAKLWGTFASTTMKSGNIWHFFKWQEAAWTSLCCVCNTLPVSYCRLSLKSIFRRTPEFSLIIGTAHSDIACNPQQWTLNAPHCRKAYSPAGSVMAVALSGHPFCWRGFSRTGMKATAKNKGSFLLVCKGPACWGMPPALPLWVAFHRVNTRFSIAKCSVLNETRRRYLARMLRQR